MSILSNIEYSNFHFITYNNLNLWIYAKIACLAKCASCSNTVGTCTVCTDSTHRTAAPDCNCTGSYYGEDSDAACTCIVFFD